MKLIAFIAVLVSGLTGCAGVVGGGSRSWKEQVILPDGRELIVERSHTLGNRFDRELSAINSPPGATAYVVTVPLPDGRKVRWEGEHKEMIPIAVAVEGSTAYVLASPFNCRSYSKLGRPVPLFIVFKHDGRQWMRTTIDEVPQWLVEANLLIATDSQRAINEFDKGIVTAKTVKRMNEAMIERQIYRKGVNNYLWGGCLGVQSQARNYSYTQFIGEFGDGIYRGTDADGHEHASGGRGSDDVGVSGGGNHVSGGKGNDTVRAFGLNNTIHYSAGDGTDTVWTNVSGNPGNVLRLSGIDASQLRLGLDASRYLVVTAGENADDRMVFQRFDASSVAGIKAFDHIEFDAPQETPLGGDGSTLSYDDLMASMPSVKSRRWQDGDMSIAVANESGWRVAA
ncbi:MAG: hypothetical protein IPN05_08000 [Sulfuritalea sp.]|nr:hypothetical protein [Sulfuritalea sp.]